MRIEGRKLRIASLLSSLNICWGFVASIQAPFLPIEARSKGATASQFGPIFGIIHLALFITSPIVGNLVTKFGLGNIFKIGLVLTCVSTLVFGFLTYINNTVMFLVGAYVLRIVEGVGGAALWTSMLSLLLAIFPENTGLVYSLVDATFGVGYTLGPVLGAGLYKLGGFLTPFLTSGAAVVVTGGLSVWVCRSVTQEAETSQQVLDDGHSILPILRSSGSLISLISASVAALTIGYIESLLVLYLQTTFSLSVTSISLCFLSMAVSYTSVTIMSGYLADKLVHPVTITILGLLILLLSFTLIGPVPYLPIQPHQELTVFSLVLQGAGAGAVVVSSYSSCLLATLTIQGYSPSVSTYSVVSGLWTSAFALGNFVGPTVAGFIYEQIGFCWGTVLVQIILCIVITMNCWLRLGCRYRRIHNNDVYEEI